MQQKPWGFSWDIEDCQKYTLKKYLLLSGQRTELQKNGCLTTLQVINGNCYLYSKGKSQTWTEAADVEFDENEELMFLDCTELAQGDVIQLIPNTPYRLAGHGRNDAFILITEQKISIEILDDEND